MLIPIPPKRRRSRRVRPRPVIAPRPTLGLVSAIYLVAPQVTLTFDRAVDISGLVGATIVVDDPIDMGVRYVAAHATLIGPETVEIVLTEAGSPTGTGITLSAGAGNGIVATDDGAAWPGVTDLLLPFP